MLHNVFENYKKSREVQTEDILSVNTRASCAQGGRGSMLK